MEKIIINMDSFHKYQDMSIEKLIKIRNNYPKYCHDEINLWIGRKTAEYNWRKNQTDLEKKYIDYKSAKETEYSEFDDDIPF